MLSCGLSIAKLVTTAWASAATSRSSDKRGSANGARIRLAPQNDWEINQPEDLVHVLAKLEAIRTAFDSKATGGKQVSMADLIVLGGCAAVEVAAKKARYAVQVPFSAGRTDASKAQTDAVAFAVLEPVADGFRNYVRKGLEVSANERLLSKAQLLTLSAPEMAVLIAGMRVLCANYDHSTRWVFTTQREALTPDFFINLLDMRTIWHKSASAVDLYEGRDHTKGVLHWTASGVDLVFGSDAELRAIAEAYASADAQTRFVYDFVAAWTKVMNLDRFERAASLESFPTLF